MMVAGTSERDHWDRHFAAGNGFRRVDAHEARSLAGAVPPRAGARALDVGCGLGTYAAVLAGLGYRTLAVDWSEAAVAATRDRYADLEPRLSTRRLDFADAAEVTVRLPRAGFDLVTMRLALAFLPDKTAVADRVRGLPAPGGHWLVTTCLTSRLPTERHRIGLSPDDVAAMTDGWPLGHWYDLEPTGMRCFVLRRPTD